MADDTPHSTSRFVDVEFHNKKLSPICGYWNEKLVSLEDALKFIEPRSDELENSIKTAKKDCHFPSEHGLTHDESAAIFLYTMEEGDHSLHRVLNQALRSEDRSVVKSWFPYLKLFDTALTKLPTVKKNIWRGVIGDISQYFNKNEELTWWSITSCSLSMLTIMHFLASETTMTLILIEAVHGKYVTGYTKYPNEDEVLLGPGTQLRVVSDALDHPGGVNVVHLVEVSEDSDEQLASAMSTISILPEIVNKSTFKPHQHQRFALVCGGRRCPNCKRCRDWHYSGILDSEISNGTYNRKNWQRVQGATCRYHYDVHRFGDRIFEHRFRNFRDRDHQHFCRCNQNK
ncbi:unnamed protein product [Adineta steineri]|uniref:NAD(P)(+)--arginine ADP-ribosyltransferase n=1 Tax=Adineta steineri TaxID=433720 RepID=A0A819UEI1_9BILA|nr:unnamed protein product [Adineta steineri]